MRDGHGQHDAVEELVVDHPAIAVPRQALKNSFFISSLNCFHNNTVRTELVNAVSMATDLNETAEDGAAAGLVEEVAHHRRRSLAGDEVAGAGWVRPRAGHLIQRQRFQDAGGQQRVVVGPVRRLVLRRPRKVLRAQVGRARRVRRAAARRHAPAWAPNGPSIHWSVSWRD